ncbi:unnamed protein product [Victoria cruziana]
MAGMMSVKVAAFLLVLAATTSSSRLFAHAAFRARLFKVGGQQGWVVSPSEPFNHWSQNQSFRKFDHIYFKYKAGEDSVLLVSKEAYQVCNTTNPVNSFTDGNTNIELPHSGPLYFISGQPGHCEKGQKLIVRVLADRSPPTSSQSPLLPPATSSQPPKGKAPTPPPPMPPSSPSPAAQPSVHGEDPVSPTAPSSQPEASAPAPAASGAALSASLCVVGLATMVIGWMVVI